MAWWDFYKIFNYSFEPDPIEQSETDKGLTGAGITTPEAIPNIRQDGSFWGGSRGRIRLRETNDMVDLSTISNRKSRYKEYERLRNVPEIESVMTIVSEEACLVAGTKIATPFYGYKSIKWFAENKKNDEFFVYCWDFEKNDYTIGLAYDAREVKNAKVIKIMTDDGKSFKCTSDHRILKRDGEWIEAGQLKYGDELMPFYRTEARKDLSEQKTNQFPRIFTFDKGWIHERHFIDEWKKTSDNEDAEKLFEITRAYRHADTRDKIADIVKCDPTTVTSVLNRNGFSLEEQRWLNKKPTTRKVIGVANVNTQAEPVYDISVQGHENFCGESVIFHNCQRGENDHVFEIKTKNENVKRELEFLFFHKRMLNLDRKSWSMFKNLCIFGDEFLEILINIDNPKDGVLGLMELPAESMYRIETIQAKILEYQQAEEGPDLEALIKAPIGEASDSAILQSKAIRFNPKQIVHMKIGDDRKTYYPYGQSLIEPARGPAHQLRMMEDAMLVYRLSRSPERRVFYIDSGNLAPNRIEAFMDRIKDQFRKKKVAKAHGAIGANSVEERWHAPAIDEDIWMPIRGQSNSRIETLPGATNLGEKGDVEFFQNKLFTALNFPKNYLSNTDPGVTRIALSAQDVKFARMIERLQESFADGMWEIADRHLKLRGIPQEAYDDLQIKMTPPSEWRELTRAEILTSRIGNATQLKGSMLLSDFDIHTKILKYDEDEAQDLVSRLELQKLKEMKMQILASNPRLAGIGVPGDGEQQLGAEPNGMNPMLSPDAGQNEQKPESSLIDNNSEAGNEAVPGQPEQGLPEPNKLPEPTNNTDDTNRNSSTIEEPTSDEIKKYDLEIQNYSREQDDEEIDYSEM